MIFGYRRDPPHKRTQKSSRHLLGDAPSTPASASVESFEYRPILDQSQTGSCVGHGTAQCIFTACAAAGSPLAFCPSPFGIYTPTRCLERIPLPDGTLPPLEDRGASPADAMTAISQWGVRPMRAPSPQGFNSDIDASNVLAEPALVDLESSATHLVMGEHRIDETAVDVVAQIRAALAAGFPVGLGFFCDTAFQNWSAGDAPLDALNPADPSGGGHWVMISSYWTLADGTTVLRITNSWTDTWGDGGHVNVTEAWLKKAAMDLYLFNVKVST